VDPACGATNSRNRFTKVRMSMLRRRQWQHQPLLIHSFFVGEMRAIKYYGPGLEAKYPSFGASEVTYATDPRSRSTRVG
jgi:hypothetical protein